MVVFLILFCGLLGFYRLYDKYIFHGNNYDQNIILSTTTIILPISFCILIHDLYIYFKYRLGVYFHNYAGMGFRLLAILIYLAFFLCLVMPVFSLFIFSVLINRILYYMSLSYHYRNSSNFYHIVSQDHSQVNDISPHPISPLSPRSPRSPISTCIDQDIDNNHLVLSLQ
jgi:hypothetical protein